MKNLEGLKMKPSVRDDRDKSLPRRAHYGDGWLSPLHGMSSIKSTPSWHEASAQTPKKSRSKGSMVRWRSGPPLVQEDSR
mmetsp:Transcript_113286/g.360082  ORF Transcript_113286/g.360082 Transcript_113286/m.360082 type:complete len:80 (+) Transcript_113286:753-992(+)